MTNSTRVPRLQKQNREAAHELFMYLRTHKFMSEAKLRDIVCSTKGWSNPNNYSSEHNYKNIKKVLVNTDLMTIEKINGMVCYSATKKCLHIHSFFNTYYKALKNNPKVTRKVSRPKINTISVATVTEATQFYNRYKDHIGLTSILEVISHKFFKLAESQHKAFIKAMFIVVVHDKLRIPYISFLRALADLKNVAIDYSSPEPEQK